MRKSPPKNVKSTIAQSQAHSPVASEKISADRNSAMHVYFFRSILLSQSITLHGTDEVHHFFGSETQLRQTIPVQKQTKLLGTRTPRHTGVKDETRGATTRRSRRRLQNVARSWLACGS
jgi:hypothetical protein